MSQAPRGRFMPGGGHGRNPGAGMPAEKARNFGKTVQRLLKYMRPRILGIICVFILAILSTIFSINTPKILGGATTEIYDGILKGKEMAETGQPLSHLPINYNRIIEILFIVGLLYIGSSIFSFFQQYLMTRISQHTVYELRKEFKAKMNTVPMQYYDTHNNGDLLSRAINDMDNIANTLQQSLTQLVTSLVTFVGILYMMLTISWQLTLIALITVPLSLVVVGIIAPKSQRYFSAQQKNLGLLNNRVEETYGGHTVIKAFGKEKDSIEIFEKYNKLLFKASWKAQFISGLIMPLMNFIKNTGYIFVAVVGAIKVTQGTITLGNVQAILQYTHQFSQPITQLANILNTIQSTVASAERIFEVLDEADMTNHPSHILPEKNSPYKVEFEHVQFGYGSRGDDLLLTDFNLKVKSGQMIAIVGPTGAGKTTLINLLMRFYDISGGSIRLDGTDTRDMSRESLRTHFGMVLQDTWLFKGTIQANIEYGNKNATEEQMFEASKAAHVDEFVRKLPQGYETVLNEEASNISLGQRQLITIARAFLSNPDILILDEATSSVDTRTEVLIQKAMRNLLRGRTAFVVAHRLSTIRDADNIIVMNNGSVIETGTHEELMKKAGFYSELYQSQFSDPQQ